MTEAILQTCQREFMALLLDESRTLPQGWDAARLAIYRNAYRARLVDALRETYPRTERWVGEAAFRRAAVHHLITHPPAGWTLDAVGEGFSDTLAELFQKDPEVKELAWLEWAMHRCSVSANALPIDASGFKAATVSFREDDWGMMRLQFVPGTQQARITHRIGRLWGALGDDISDAPAIDYSSGEPLSCIVWRQGLTPVSIPVDALEGRAIAITLGGGCYGELCNTLIDALGEEEAVVEAGAMLGRWLQHGMIAGVSLAR